MNLRTKKELAAHVLNVSPKRVMFNPERLDEIKEALTRADIKALVNDGAIIKKQKKSISSFRAKKIAAQKSKGRRRGQGSRKGTQKARANKKVLWMNRVRLQRKYLNTLREKGVLDTKTFRKVYLRVKAGSFRSKAHLNLFMKDMKILKSNNIKKAVKKEKQRVTKQKISKQKAVNANKRSK